MLLGLDSEQRGPDAWPDFPARQVRASVPTPPIISSPDCPRSWTMGARERYRSAAHRCLPRLFVYERSHLSHTERAARSAAVVGRCGTPITTFQASVPPDPEAMANRRYAPRRAMVECGLLRSGHYVGGGDAGSVTICERAKPGRSRGNRGTSRSVENREAWRVPRPTSGGITGSIGEAMRQLTDAVVLIHDSPCNHPCNPTRLKCRLPAGGMATPWNSIPALSGPYSMRGTQLDTSFESGRTRTYQRGKLFVLSGGDLPVGASHSSALQASTSWTKRGSSGTRRPRTCKSELTPRREPVTRRQPNVNFPAWMTLGVDSVARSPTGCFSTNGPRSRRVAPSARAKREPGSNWQKPLIML